MRNAIIYAALAAASLAAAAAGPALGAAAPVAEAPIPPPPHVAPPPPANAKPAGPIATAQQELKEAGYDPGPVNGVMTRKTQQAVARYRRRTGRLPAALAAAADGDPVKFVQAALKRLGIYGGRADGRVGPATRDAIVRFEAAKHLKVDPRVDDRLIAALAEAGAMAPPPAAAAQAPNAAAAAPPAAGPAPPPQAASPEALGRRPLPSSVHPPPIR